ncbi:hypothetical protein [Lacipirellula parvula]|uniref:Uncharacterized protein n=1 Tax=Lacipirellula parvula TaxID=2650471 RepID=A0A5K7XDA8_9BACT|nr:hypothetical protein [Lacipirellula parvula]BBO34458.1 hypothetical protein PLANPX_4070 [Lacipirellula parvula]
MVAPKRKYTNTARKLQSAALLGDTLYDAPSNIPRFRKPTRPLVISSTPKLFTHPLLLKQQFDFAWPGTKFFPDTCFFSRKPPWYLVEACLASGICITPSMLAELKPWVADTPFRELLWAAVRRESAPGMVELLAPAYVQSLPAYQHYLALLKYRKQVGELAVRLLEHKSKKEPTDAQIDAELQRRFGARGAELARKGWDERASPNRFVDEEFVVTATLTAIMLGREVPILTFDTDVHNQFAKLAHLICDDYRSMLVAEEFQRNPFTFGSRSQILNGRAVGLKLRHSEVCGLVPSDPFTNAYCFLFGNDFRDLRISRVDVNFPLDVQRLLNIKQSTGRNTDILGTRNCRVSSRRNFRGSVVAVAIINDDDLARVGTQIFAYEDLKEVLAEDDTVVYPAVEGIHDSEVNYNRELVLPGLPGDAFYMSEEARTEMEQSMKRRQRDADRQYCMPICLDI